MKTVLLLVPLLLQDTKVQSDVEVRPLAGEIQVWRHRSRKTEKPPGPVVVSPEDRIGALGETVARIALDGDVVLVLKGVEAKPEAGLSAQRLGQKLLLKLYKGSAVVESLETEVAVETPHGKAEGKAAYFLLEVTREKSRIVAIDGSLTYTTRLGQVTLEAGESLTADGKKAPVRGGDAADPSWASTPGNVVENPSFELGFTDWEVAEVDGRKLAAIDDKLARSGTKSARIDLPVPSKRWLLFEAHYGSLAPGTRQMFRAWVRAENFAGDVSISFQFMRKDQQIPDSAIAKKFTVKPGAWTCLRFFLTPPGDGYEMCVLPGEAAGGTLWFDDFFLAPLPAR
ncbi:MAG TPA: hypothetical protein VF950_27220 [Planctomycetota bacterium]